MILKVGIEGVFCIMNHIEWTEHEGFILESYKNKIQRITNQSPLNLNPINENSDPLVNFIYMIVKASLIRGALTAHLI